MGIKYTEGHLILHEESCEQFLYNRDGDLEISELGTDFTEGLQPSTEAILNRPLHAKPFSHSHLFMPECILP